MKEYICPICEQSFQEGAVPEKCPECGCDRELFNVIDEMSREELAENVSDTLESSNSYAAEHTANTVAEVIAFLGTIFGLIMLIVGIVGCVESGKNGGNGWAGVPIIISGLLFFLLCLIAWAFIKLQVNISYRLTRIDNKLNPKQKSKQKPAKTK